MYEVEKRLREATEEEVVEDYIGQEVRAGAQEVAVEVLRYYTEKKRTHEIKKVRLILSPLILQGLQRNALSFVPMDK